MAVATGRVQELIQAVATEKPKVALDTCCVEYFIGKPVVQPWADCLDPIFQAALNGQIELYVSTVVVSELLAHAYHRNTGYDQEKDLLAIINRHFQVLEVDSEVAKVAGKLRGYHAPGNKITLKTADALIGATSLANGHTLFITNDAKLAYALPKESCIYLKDLALDWLAQNFPGRCLDSARTVNLSRRGSGLFPNGTLVSSELGSIQPDPSANWRRILADAFTSATMLNEPCIFFVLTRREGRKTKIVEVLFWHEGLENIRTLKAVIRHIENHLGYSHRTGRVHNSTHHAYAFCFASLKRERVRQAQPSCASKCNDKKEAEAWEGYLRLLWHFCSTLRLPQTTWLFCEDGIARYLKPHETLEFLERAKNVFGWEGNP